MSLTLKVHHRLAVVLLAGVAGCADRPTPLAVVVSAGPVSSLAGAPDRFLSNGATRIRYREVGRGEPVLLLHGYTDRLEMWTGVADSLAVDRRVIVPDLRGFGGSDKPIAPGSYGSAMTGDVAALLDTLRVDRVDLIGYSLGALVTADLAVRYPERVRTAVLVAGPFFPDSAGLARMVAPHVAELERGDGLIGFFRRIVPTLPDSVLVPMAEEFLTGNDLGALIGSLRELGQLVPDSSALATVAVPAVAVVGRTDPLLSHSRWLGGVWKGLKLVELAEADHAVVFGVPEVVAEFRAISRR
jgi:pimeloyl-ACP methyl ester carboxylesterase